MRSEPPPRVAAVDIGTNTALLLIAERGHAGLSALVEVAEIVRLGQGVDRSGRLADEAVERTLAVLSRYGELIRQHRVARLAAVGTQALREVSNGADFLARASRALGCPIEVIAGEREARLCWRAATASFPRQPGERRTVIDIGGGSTEILVGGEEVEALLSVPIGAVRLTERCLHGDPPGVEECRALVAQVDEALGAAPRPVGHVIGVAGTATTLLAIELGLTTYDPARVHGARLTRQQVAGLVSRLATLSISERRRLPGLDPRRADVIYAGAVILDRVLARGDAEGLTVSDRGIRWGLAEEQAGMC